MLLMFGNCKYIVRSGSHFMNTIDCSFLTDIYNFNVPYLKKKNTYFMSINETTLLRKPNDVEITYYRSSYATKSYFINCLLTKGNQYVVFTFKYLLEALR